MVVFYWLGVIVILVKSIYYSTQNGLFSSELYFPPVSRVCDHYWCHKYISNITNIARFVITQNNNQYKDGSFVQNSKSIYDHCWGYWNVCLFGKVSVWIDNRTYSWYSISLACISIISSVTQVQVLLKSKHHLTVFLFSIF